MKIFLDFDRTLLDTGGLVAKLYRPFLEKEGFTPEEIEGSYSSFARGVDPTKETFTLEKHLGVLNMEQERQRVCLPEIKSFFEQAENFLFPGAKEFLEALSDHEITLLTFGDKDFQALKVNASGVKKYCKDVCFTEGSKADEIEKRIEKEEAFFFVDDQAGYFEILKERFGNRSHGVHFLHPFNQKDCEGCCADIHATDFETVIRYIQSVCAE